MFNFTRNIGGKSAAKIVSTREDLIYDEYPVLYTGLNSSGGRVIGSYISRDDNDDEEIIYFVNTVVSKSAFQSFLDKAITYRELIEASQEVYILEKNYDSLDESFYTISTEEFPADYLPGQDSFYPKQEIQPSLDFTFRLTGNLADENKAITKQASVVALAMSALLEQSINALKLRRVRVLQLPSSEGSFKLNFEVQFLEGTQLTMGAGTAVAKFQTDFLDYCINNLPGEVGAVFTENIEARTAPNYIILRDSFKELHKVLGKPKKDPITDEFIDKLLRDDIAKAINNLSKASEDLGIGFDSIEVSNNSLLHKNVISTINAEVKSRIDYAAEFIEAADEDFIEDTEFKDYKITIYNLNTDTRAGNAIIFSGTNDQVMSRPRIRILGTDALEQTSYTNSLHSGTPIHVQGKARKTGDKFSFIEIDSVE